MIIGLFVAQCLSLSSLYHICINELLKHKAITVLTALVGRLCLSVIWENDQNGDKTISFNP